MTQTRADDREFLPSALAMVSAPPSPIRMRLMLAICALVCVLLAMSWLGKVDIYAIAAARVQPVGRTKVIQPLFTGKVKAVYVQNGSKVSEGDLLVELDPTESVADRDANAGLVDALRAEIARRQTAIEAARSGVLEPAPVIAFDPGIDEAAIARERAVLVADLSRLQSGLRAVDGRIAEASAQRKALQLTIVEQERLVETLRRRVDMLRAVFDKQLGSKASVIDGEEALGEGMTVLANRRGELLQVEAAIASLEMEKEHKVFQFIAENSEALAQAQTRRLDAAQDFIKSNARVDYTRLTAPTAGTVQQLIVTAPGQVLAAGEPVMTIVPQQDALEAEALVLNRDIGFVEVGQPAVVKLDAFPFTRYGALTGTIVRVSTDATALTEDGSSIQAPRPISAIRDLVYPVTVKLDSNTMRVEGKHLPLTAGMTATIEIRTGERRLLEYFLSPLLEVMSRAAHER